MKKGLFTLAVIAGLFSCNGQTPESKTEVSKNEAEKIGSLTVTDKSLYDPSFIEGFKDSEAPVKLDGNYIFFENEKYEFPNVIALEERKTFKGEKDGKSFTLVVSRDNLTTLNYNFRVSDGNNRLLDTQSGKATIGSFFFFGSESDEDPETGESYFVYEYSFAKEDCWFSIRIADEKDANGKLRAKVYSGCETGKNNITLEDCPILLSE